MKRLFLALLGLVMCLNAVTGEAQTPRDTALRKVYDSLQTVKVANDRYCKTGSVSSYMKTACKTIDNNLPRLDSLTKLVVVVVDTPPTPPKPPVDSSKPPIDSAKPPPIVATNDSFPTIQNYGNATIAELPRIRYYPPQPVIKRTVRVAAGSNVQAIINSASCGDALAFKGVWIGNYTLPVKPCSDSEWVIITSDTAIAPGVARPLTSIGLAKFYTNSYSAVFQTDLNANHYWLDGIEIAPTPNFAGPEINMLVNFNGAGATNISQVPNHLAVTRSYIHGNTNLNIKRGIVANSAFTYIAQNWISEIHYNGADDQCILGYNGTKGVTIYQNHCEAGHEITMLGGADATDSTFSPRDVTIRQNHIVRPQSWYKVWQVKNCSEVKNINRLDYVGNIVENNWADAQAGFCILLKSENQGGNPFTETSNITVRWNKIVCTGNFMNLIGNGGATPAVNANKLTVYQNYVTNVNVAPCSADGIVFQTGNAPDVTIVDNTIENNAGSNSAITFAAPAPRLTFLRNNLWWGQYGIKGANASSGNVSIQKYAADGSFLNNNFVKGDCSVLPATNTCSVTSNVGADLTTLNSIITNTAP